MAKDSKKISPTLSRQDRLTGFQPDLEDALSRAIKVATGRGPVGRDASIGDARQEMAPKLVGVISLKAVFQERPWIFVTAPGPMMLGYRGQELLAVCHKVHCFGRPVLLLKTNDVLHLSFYYNERLKRPQYLELRDDLKLALQPLYAPDGGDALLRPVRSLDSY